MSADKDPTKLGENPIICYKNNYLGKESPTLIEETTPSIEAMRKSGCRFILQRTR